LHSSICEKTGWKISRDPKIIASLKALKNCAMRFILFFLLLPFSANVQESQLELDPGLFDENRNFTQNIEDRVDSNVRFD
jgi:hypothetical protein